MLALPDLTLLLSVAAAVLIVTPFLGRYMASVMEGQRTILSPVLRPVERAVYRVSGIDEASEQGWRSYCGGAAALQPRGHRRHVRRCCGCRTSCR